MPLSKQSAKRELTIERGVPMPNPIKEFARTKYPFGQMSVGDSFKIPNEIIRSARNSAYLYGMRNDMKFSCRRIDDTHYRVWRIA